MFGEISQDEVECLLVSSLECFRPKDVLQRLAIPRKKPSPMYQTLLVIGRLGWKRVPNLLLQLADGS